MVALAASYMEKPMSGGVRWIFFLTLSVLLNFVILMNVDIRLQNKVIEIPKQIRISFNSLAGSASAPAQKQTEPVQAPLEKMVEQVNPEPVSETSEVRIPDPEPVVPAVTAVTQIDPVVTKPEAFEPLPVIEEKVEVIEAPKPEQKLEDVAINAPRPRLKPKNLKVIEPITVPDPKAIKKIEKKIAEKKQLVESKTVTEARIQPENMREEPQEFKQSNVAEAASSQDTSKTDLNEKGKGPSTIISDARYKFRKPVAYPTQARRRGQQGKVKLHVLVSKSGFPVELKIAQSSGFSLLDKAAVAAVRKWEFIPPVTNNETQLSWVSVPVDFVLRH